MNIEQAEEILESAKREQAKNNAELETLRSEIDRLSARRDTLLWANQNALTREVDALKYLVASRADA